MNTEVRTTVTHSWVFVDIRMEHLRFHPRMLVGLLLGFLLPIQVRRKEPRDLPMVRWLQVSYLTKRFVLSMDILVLMMWTIIASIILMCI